jgi:AcrR family transcriptional regulator
MMMDEKRHEIITKVRALYRNYGIKSVTMDDVSHHLTISKKTLYQYFRDKDELVAAVVDCDIESKQIELQFRNDNLNAVEEVIQYYKIQINIIKDHKPAFVYDLKKYYPDIFEKVRQQMREKIISLTEANIIKGKKEGLYRHDIDEEIIAKLNLMRIEGIMYGDLFEPEQRTSAHLFTEIHKYHMYALVSEKGRLILERLLSELELINA